MMHPAGTFHYKLVLRGTEPPWRLVALSEDLPGPIDEPISHARLVGHSPAVDVWGDRITLIARHPKYASKAAVFFPIDPAIPDRLQGGDVLWLVRTGAAGL